MSVQRKELFKSLSKEFESLGFDITPIKELDVKGSVLESLINKLGTNSLFSFCLCKIVNYPSPCFIIDGTKIDKSQESDIACICMDISFFYQNPLSLINAILAHEVAHMTELASDLKDEFGSGSFEQESYCDLAGLKALDFDLEAEEKFIDFLLGSGNILDFSRACAIANAAYKRTGRKYSF